MDRVYEELGIPEKWRSEFDSWDVEYHEDTGSSDEMVYGFYFYVPEEANEEFLKEMDWEVGGCVTLSASVFNDDYPDEEPEPYP